MALTFPAFKSQFSQYVTNNNFMALQSAKLDVTASSGSISFPDFSNTSGRITVKISNTGTNAKDCYLASGTSSATAVVPSSTPQPVTGSVSNCDCIPAGTIQVLDFPAGTYTFAAICDGSDTTSLKISLGYGQ